MPRYASYRKFRKFARRQPKTTFSKYSTYKNRSSKAQAYQIYRLNKKINWIQKRTKPETNISPILSRTFSHTWNDEATTHPLLVYSSSALTNLRPEGTTPDPQYSVLKGRFARLQSLTLKGILSYNVPGYESDGATSPSDVPFPDRFMDLQRMPVLMRLVMIQTRTTRGAGLAQADVFNPDLQNLAAIRGPLATGLSRIAHVLCDKQYMISDTSQIKNIKVKCKYLKNWYTAPSEVYAKGNVEVHVLIYNPSDEIKASL